MSFKLLSQMERTRHEKEDALRNTGFSASLIVIGVFVSLASILLLGGVALAVPGETQATASPTGSTNFIPVCASLTVVFGLLGFIFILASTLRRRKLNRDLEAAESEFQLLQSQVIDMLERHTL